MNRNLVGSIYGMSSMTIAHFVPIGQQAWPPHAIIVSDCSISKTYSPLKLLSHMNRNLIGNIYMYERFCIKFPQSIKVSDTGSVVGRFVLLNCEFSVQCFVDRCLSFFFLAFVLSVLQFKDSNYTFKLFLRRALLISTIRVIYMQQYKYPKSYRMLFRVNWGTFDL